jgi:hypothetical protein
MRITVELRADPADYGIAGGLIPGQAASLSGDGWSVPVSIRAVAASFGAAEDEDQARILGPGYVLDDDAEAWVAVM